MYSARVEGQTVGCFQLRLRQHFVLGRIPICSPLIRGGCEAIPSSVSQSEKVSIPNCEGATTIGPA